MRLSSSVAFILVVASLLLTTFVNSSEPSQQIVQVADDLVTSQPMADDEKLEEGNDKMDASVRIAADKGEEEEDERSVIGGALTIKTWIDQFLSSSSNESMEVEGRKIKKKTGNKILKIIKHKIKHKLKKGKKKNKFKKGKRKKIKRKLLKHSKKLAKLALGGGGAAGIALGISLPLSLRRRRIPDTDNDGENDATDDDDGIDFDGDGSDQDGGDSGDSGGRTNKPNFLF